MIISVIIPAYNQAGLLRKAVISLLECDYPDEKYEIIIVNDASTDETKEVMAELQELGSRVEGRDNQGQGGRGQVVCLYHETNRNAAAARNTGILQCRDDVQILAFIDQDCTVPRNWLQVLADFFTHHPEIDFTGGYVLNEPTNIWQEWAKYMSHQICDHEDFQTKLIGTNMAFRQWVFWNNLFDEGIGYGTDETELVFRLSIQGYQFKLCEDLAVYHYHRDNFWSLVKQRWRYGIGEARFYWKYGFGIYHPINSYMLKTNLSLFLFILLLAIGYSWVSLLFGLMWVRYMSKYARIRYESFLKDKGIPLWKIPIFLSINWLVDNVVLMAKLKIGNPI